jgi:hypothetical protein
MRIGRKEGTQDIGDSLAAGGRVRLLFLDYLENIRTIRGQ